MIGDDGKLTWKTLEDIGAGDGNDNTTYQFTLGADGKSFSIKTLFNGQPIKGEDDVELDPQVITFDVYTKSEVDAKIGTASVPESAEGTGDGKAATGVYVAIEAEAARAAAAEKALDDKIGGVNTALADYAKTADVNTELAKKADKSAYDQTVLDLDALEAKVDAFLTGTGTEAALDSLQELIQYIETHDDTDISGILESIQAIENKLAGIDTTVVAYVTAAIEALKIGDYAKASDLADLAAKVDVEKVSTAIATAKQEAIDDAATKYATTGALGEVSDRVGELEKIDHTVYATKTELKATDDVAKDAQSRVGIVEGKIDEITSVGGEPNVIERIKVNDVTQTVTNKEVNITVPTKTSDLTDDTFGTLIEAAQTQANKGVADAKAAKDAADAADGKAAANATAISGLDTRLQAAETKGNDNAAAIAAHATEFATLKGRVDAHDTTLLDKANKSDVYTKEQVNAITGTPDEGKTLVAMIAEKASANNVYTKEQVYTKDEANAEIKKVTDTIGAVTEGKTLVEMIADAQTAATYDDTAIKADIKKNTDAIAILNGDAETAGSVAKVASDTAKAEVAAIVDSAPEAFDTLKEIATWIAADETATEALVERVAANEKAVKTDLPAAIAQALTDAKVYTDTEVAKILPDGTTIVKNEAGKFAVNQVTTDMIVNGTQTLVLNGGSAKTQITE